MKRFAWLTYATPIALLTWAAWAQHDAGEASAPEDTIDPACLVSDVNLLREEELTGRSLSYFISSADDAVVFISEGNKMKLEGSNHVMELPGAIDPVVTPDARFFTVPDFPLEAPASEPAPEATPSTGPVAPDPRHFRENEAVDAEGYEDLVPEGGEFDPSIGEGGPFVPSGLAFFDLQAAKQQAKDGKASADLKPIYIDPDFTGSYQSMGTFKKNGKTFYRALNDGSVRDYVAGPGGSIGPADPEGTVGSLCSNVPNMDGLRQLPMISKDGQYVSFYETGRQTTVIYKLSPEDPSLCEKVLDLGFPTGKVDFNADNSMITFHVDNFNLDTSQFASIEPGYSKDIMVMKLKKGPNGAIQGVDGYSRLTARPDDGAGTYYPRFRKDGSIVAARDHGDRFSLAYFKTQGLKFTDPWTPKLGARGEPSQRVHAEYALGGLWRQACGSKVPTATQARWMALSLDPVACRKLVETKWEQHRQSVLTQASGVRGLKTETLQSLRKEDLLALCPTADPALTRSAVSRNGAGATGSNLAPLDDLMKASSYNVLAQLFQANCMECHRAGANVQGARVFDLNSLSKESLQTAAALVSAGVMPKVREMRPADRAKLADLLQDAARQRMLSEQSGAGDR